jgi:hypothetical protein
VTVRIGATGALIAVRAGTFELNRKPFGTFAAPIPVGAVLFSFKMRVWHPLWELPACTAYSPKVRLFTSEQLVER